LPAYEFEGSWKAHAGKTFHLAFTPDGRGIVSAGEDGKLLLWNARTERPRTQTYGPANSAKHVGAHARHRLVAAAGKSGVALVDPETGGVVAQVAKPVRDEWRDVDVSRDGRSIVAEAPGGPLVHWRNESGAWRESLRWELPGGFSDIAISPDGGAASVRRGERDGFVLLDLTTSQSRSGFVAHGCSAMAWSPDGRWFAAAERVSDDILVFAAASQQLIYRFDKHRTTISALAFSQDGRLLASADEDRDVAVWDVQQGANRWMQTLTSELDRRGYAEALAFSPRGGTLLAASFNGVVSAWHVGTGRELFQFDDGLDQVDSMAFCHNGRYLCLENRERLSVIDTGLPVDAAAE
jgi:WD40 repeat protein